MRNLEKSPKELAPEEKEARRGRDFEEIRKQMIKETEEGVGKMLEEEKENKESAS